MKTENDSLTLTCAATCNPPCKYTWSKDGQQIIVGDHLEFSSLTKYDQGTYRCTANNNIGSDQQYDVGIQVQCKCLYLVSECSTISLLHINEIYFNSTTLCFV